MTFSIPVIYPTARVKTDEEIRDEQNREQIRAMRQTLRSSAPD